MAQPCLTLSNLTHWDVLSRALAEVLLEKGALKLTQLQDALDAIQFSDSARTDWPKSFADGIAQASVLRKMITFGDLTAARGDSVGHTPTRLFQAGDLVRVNDEDAPISSNKPFLPIPGYLFGIVGTVETACGQTGNKDPNYRVRFFQADLWEGYLQCKGQNNDTFVVEIAQSWLLPALTEDLTTQKQWTCSHTKGTHQQDHIVHTHQHDHHHSQSHMHDHDHDHDHKSRADIEQNAVDAEGRAAEEGRLTADLVKVFQAKGIIKPAELWASVEKVETDGSHMVGAAIVAEAWTDIAFHSRLCQNAAEAIQDFGVSMEEGTTLHILENNAHTHNVVVCTLCSCYPTALLGPAPSWYKARSYRARIVRNPRAVLQEFGTEIPKNVRVQVFDSNPDARYLVIPKRPAGTEGWSKEKLRELVSRDSMIGTACATKPAQARQSPPALSLSRQESIASLQLQRSESRVPLMAAEASWLPGQAMDVDLPSSAVQRHMHGSDKMPEDDPSTGLPQRFLPPHQTRFQAWVGRFAHVAGTLPCMALVVAGSLAWVFSGFALHFNNLWQIIMNDAGSMVCWFWDILLLIGQTQSTDTFEAQLNGWIASGQDQLAWVESAVCAGRLHPQPAGERDIRPRQEPARMPSASAVDVAADKVAWAAGWPFTQFMNVVGVMIWIGFGPSRNFNNTWQLDINTAYAQQILLLTPFLHNRQHRHSRYIGLCTKRVEGLGAGVGRQLRDVAEDQSPAKSLAPLRMLVPRNLLDRIIGSIVHFVGSRWGLCCAVIIVIAWASIGKPMGWSDSWWLMLNTITGVMGFMFSFLVRYAIRRDIERLYMGFEMLRLQDQKLLDLLGISHIPPQPESPKGSLPVRFSRGLGWALSQPLATLGSILFVAGLLIVGGSLHFNFLGQLICNTPTMILEGWNLHFLLPAHAESHARMLQQVDDIIYRRQLMADALARLGHPTVDVHIDGNSEQLKILS